MNPELLQACEYVMSQIMRRPISNFFCGNLEEVKGNESIRLPIGLDIINLKLSKNYYSCYADYIRDVNQLFSYYTANDKTMLISCSARQLQKEFNELTTKFAGNISIRINQLNTLYTYFDALATKLKGEFEPTEEDEEDEWEPAAEIFREKITNPLDILNRNLDIFKSPEMAMQIAALAYKLQPEALIVNERSFRVEFAMLSEKNIKKMCKYSIQILRRIAKGEIDPYKGINEKTLFEYEFSIIH